MSALSGEAVVFPVKDGSDGHRLVAWVVTKGSTDLADDLRVELALRLPASHLPAQTITVETLPLKSNGKIDRHALSRLAHAMTAPSASPRPASTDECAVAEAFEQVLKRDTVGVADNFFALGGNSLAAMHVVLRLRKSVAPGLSMQSIFQPQTPQMLASLVGMARRAQVSQDRHIDEMVL